MATVSLKRRCTEAQKEFCVGNQCRVAQDSAGGVLLLYKLGALKLKILWQGDQWWYALCFEIELHGATKEDTWKSFFPDNVLCFIGWKENM